MRQSDPWVGQTLGGTYQILKLLGQGGMGSVYLCRHGRTHGLLALKLLRADLAAQPDVLQRFAEEARIVCALRHPHVVSVHDLVEGEGRSPYLIMEYLEGEDLEARLQREQRLPFSVLLPLCKQVGSALHAAHQGGIVHRDVKPNNVFLVPQEHLGSKVEVAKVLDFGIAKVRHTLSQRTGAGVVLGTPQYLSPEVLDGRCAQVDGRADQWALAVLLYRAIAGRLPFDGPTMDVLFYQILCQPPPPLGDLCPQLPKEVRAAITRALQKRREDRFPDIAQFVHALSAAVMPATPARRSAAIRTGLQMSAIFTLAGGLGALGGVVVAPTAQAIPGGKRAEVQSEPAARPGPVLVCSPPPPSAASAPAPSRPAVPLGVKHRPAAPPRAEPRPADNLNWTL